MRWSKYWSFSFSIIPSKEIPRLISFRIYPHHSVIVVSYNFGHLMRRADSLEKTLMLGGVGGRRRRGRQRMRWLGGITDWMDVFG